MTCNFRRGDRVRIKLNTCYRHWLNGLEGRITAVLHHGAVVEIGSHHAGLQKVLGPGGAVGPKTPAPLQHVMQFHELEKLS